MKHTKRILALALACLIVFSLVPPVTAQAATSVFSDVSTSHKYYKEIMFLYNNGIFTGKTATKFAPDDTILREQMVTVLWRIAGEPVVSTSANFTDNTNKKQYYYNALRWAKATGVSDGYTDGSFGVGKAMTHQEVIQFLANFAVKIVKCSASADMQNTVAVSGFSTYSWGKGTLNWAIKNKLINASKNPEFKKANNSCTRGSTALILYNFYKQFRKTYALSVSTSDASVGANPNAELMRAFFNGYLTQGKTIMDRYVNNKAALVANFKKAFGTATCIDVCYVYINSHGAPDAGLTNAKRATWLSTSDLEKLVDSYPAKFVIMIEACYSGQFVTYFKNAGSRADIISAANAAQTSMAEQITLPDATRNAYGVATACWRQALLASNPIADSKNKTPIVYAAKGGDKTYYMVGTGDGNGFVSLKELATTVIPAVTVIANAKDHKQDVCYYSPASQPAYCAFGTLD